MCGGGNVMEINARIRIRGELKSLIRGGAYTGVDVGLPGGTEIVSIITKTSADSLGLAQGKEVYAVIKASNVMLAVDGHAVRGMSTPGRRGGRGLLAGVFSA